MSDIPSGQIILTNELSHFVVNLNRINQLLVMRTSILKDASVVTKTLNRLFPHIEMVKRPTTDSLLIDSINLFFWRSVCQRQISSKRSVDQLITMKNPNSKEVLSKTEKETQKLVDSLGINVLQRENIADLQEPNRILNPRELAVLFSKALKQIKTEDPTIEEEGMIPKIDLFDLSLAQGVFSTEVGESEYTNQTGLSKLLQSKVRVTI